MCMEESVMSKDQSQTVMGIMNQMNGVSFQKKAGNSFRFRMYLTQKMCESSIEALELSVRSYNCLKRAGFDSIGELTDAIAAGTELKSIRNCGSKSVREIMEHLFVFQYNSLPAKRQQSYLEEVLRLNGGNLQ
ncbi:MAG: hypothetical protein E7294_02500 [Lachnospiraceae bacterium]|nr:hypothetical protein [Lachnospiraceae bacterium]